MRLLPNLTVSSASTIPAGSLVYSPTSEKWGIKHDAENVYWLDSMRSSSPKGALANLGKSFHVQFDVARCTRFADPWDQVSVGSLLLYQENELEVMNTCIYLNTDHDERAHVFDLSEGSYGQLPHDLKDCIAMPVWKLGYAEDRSDREAIWIHRFQPPD